MEIRGFKFDRVELAGSLGDLGVLLPLAVGMIAITGLNATVVLTGVGLFYIASGLYFRLPVPVQPLKVVAAVTIAAALGEHKITQGVIAATGITFGALLLVLAFTGLLGKIEKLFTKPIIRGIQAGLGMILIIGGIKFIAEPELFISSSNGAQWYWGISPNVIVGLVSAATALFLLKSRRFPAALVLVAMGVVSGLALGAWENVHIAVGPEHVNAVIPAKGDFITALLVLVIPQFPLSLGNAIIGMEDTARTLFGTGEITKRSTTRAYAVSMGIANIVVGFFAGMPMCHGAGGLAAHYRFGARTGGSNLMIGLAFVVLGTLFGHVSLSLLTVIPHGVLGVLLLFAGLELCLAVKDVSAPKDLFVVFLIVGIALATNNMAIAFIVGIIVESLIEKGRVRI